MISIHSAILRGGPSSTVWPSQQGRYEDVLMPYSQTYGSFNLPVEAFELLAWGNLVGIVLNNNPINAYCLCNCVIDEDRLENKKPIKVSQFRKIDGAITLLMTLGLMCTYER